MDRDGGDGISVAEFRESVQRLGLGPLLERRAIVAAATLIHLIESRDLDLDRGASEPECEPRPSQKETSPGRSAPPAVWARVSTAVPSALRAR